MTRQKQAIEFAQIQIIFNNPQFKDKNYRTQWWNNANFIERQLFIDFMTQLATMDLSREEELEVI